MLQHQDARLFDSPGSRGVGVGGGPDASARVPSMRAVNALGLAYLCTVFVPGVATAGQSGARIAFILALGLLLCALYSSRGGFIRPPGPFEWLLVVLFLSTFLTAQGISLVELSLLALLLAAMICAGSAASKASTVVLLKYFTFAGLTVSVIAIFQVSIHAPILWGYLGDRTNPVIGNNFVLPIRGLGRAVGTQGQPIPSAAAVAVGMLSLATGDIMRKRIPRVLSFLVLAGGLLATGSRSVVLVVACLLLFKIAWGVSGSHARAARVLVIGFAAVAAVMSFRNSSTVVLLSSISGLSVDHRAGALGVVENIWNGNSSGLLFGDGLKAVQGLFSDGLLAGDGLENIDNGLVTVMAQAGLVGLVLYVLVYVKALRRGPDSMKFLTALLFCLNFSFDLTEWVFPYMLLAILYGNARGTDITERYTAPDSSKK